MKLDLNWTESKIVWEMFESVYEIHSPVKKFFFSQWWGFKSLTLKLDFLNLIFTSTDLGSLERGGMRRSDVKVKTDPYF